MDLYIRWRREVRDGTAKAGQPSNVDQFRNYANREVNYLWVPNKEYYKLAHQTIHLAGIALSKKDLDDKQKTTLVTHAARSMFRQLEHLGHGPRDLQ
ncbi:MAG: hypothetical protein HC902_01880 [Calothrix sp. SM1_5_4]|nr:hypothetical protein [Calothrix sp. SM1_5_4]